MDSSSSNQVQERDTHILDIGQQCSHPSCLLVDFLPFKCQHCKLPFCQEHFRVEHHQCSEYDDSKYIAPSCPLCNQPVFIEQGRDANISMDLHLENNCSVVTGRVKAKTLPTCARVNCQKALISPLQCSSCKKKFCPTHRHPDDHRCQPVPTAAPTTSKPVATSNTPKALANFNAGAKNLNTKATAAGTAAMDAVKKSINTTAIPAARNAINSAKASASASKPKAPLPFSKMDRSFPPFSDHRSVSPKSHIIVTATSASASSLTNPTNETTVNAITSESDCTTDNETAITTTTNSNETIKPAPIIDPMSFIPRSIFAFA